MDLKQLKGDYDKSEDDLKALQSVGQIVAEVLRRLDDERCTYTHCCYARPLKRCRLETDLNFVILHFCVSKVIVKASSGPRYIVGCRNKLNRDELKPGVRVTLDMTTMTIMRKLPREVDPVVYHMMTEDPGEVAYNSIGGLSEQIRELREVRGRKRRFWRLLGDFICVPRNWHV